MSWDDVGGHEIVKQLWRTHLASGRVAPAYLLVGIEGIGKRLLAQEMAKALNCTGTGEPPCEACPSCRQIQRRAHTDVHHLASQGASEAIKIDDVRLVMSQVQLKPFHAKTHVVIIEQAERLTEEAGNSLLKMLEEPPTSTRFLLTTSQLSQCLPTMVSRCQVVRCHPLPVEAIQRILVTQAACDASLAAEVAHRSGGSAAVAMALAQEGGVSRKMFAWAGAQDPLALATEPLPQTRQDVIELLDGLMGWLRDHALALLQQPAQRVELDRCVETALMLVTLRESLEQFVSPRMVAALARESWLSLRN